MDVFYIHTDIYYINIHYSNVCGQKDIFYVYESSLLCSPKLHFFQIYSKNSKHFSILIYFKM